MNGSHSSRFATGFLLAFFHSLRSQPAHHSLLKQSTTYLESLCTYDTYIAQILIDERRAAWAGSRQTTPTVTSPASAERQLCAAVSSILLPRQRVRCQYVPTT
jgi:hypothetical protein